MDRDAPGPGGGPRAWGNHALLRRLSHPVLDFLLPTDCFVCGEPLGPDHLRGACSACWSALRPFPRNACPRCALPGHPVSDLLGPGRGTCAACRTRTSHLDSVTAAVAYDRAARAIVLRAKERGCPELYEMMTRMIRLAAADRGAETPELVVGVPSHPWHGFRRGFTPGDEMARRLAAEIGRPTAGRLVVRRWLPVATAMKRLSRAARLRAARRSFRVRGRTAQGRHVLLVDDVMTTGASLEVCAGRLKEAGASDVDAWVWARKL